jgi:hypothetical protein
LTSYCSKELDKHLPTKNTHPGEIPWVEKDYASPCENLMVGLTNVKTPPTDFK